MSLVDSVFQVVKARGETKGEIKGETKGETKGQGRDGGIETRRETSTPTTEKQKKSTHKPSVLALFSVLSEVDIILSFFPL